MHIKTQIAEKIMNEINDYLERKDSLDNILNLSQESTEKECLSVNKVENSEGYMTLLSEGSVLYQDGTIRLTCVRVHSRTGMIALMKLLKVMSQLVTEI